MFPCDESWSLLPLPPELMTCFGVGDLNGNAHNSDPNDVPAPKPPVQIPRLSLDTLSTSEQPSSSGAPEETVPDVSEMEPARNTLDSEEQGQNVEMQRVPQAISAASSEESVKVSSAASIPPPPPPPPEDAPGRYRRSASSLSQHRYDRALSRVIGMLWSVVLYLSLPSPVASIHICIPLPPQKKCT